MTGEVVDFAGEHYTITGHRPYPASFQRPHPPIVLPGGGPRTLRIASREADIIGVHPARLSNETWAEQNLADASAIAVDGKVRLIREIAGARYDEIELQTVVPFVVVTDDRDGTAEAIASGLPAAPGVGVSYLWSPGGQTTQAITVAASGSYSVAVTVNGCAGTSPSTAVTVNPVPSTPVVAAPPPRCGAADVEVTDHFGRNV